MLVCVDKITCARMLPLIQPLWRAKADALRTEAETIRATIGAIDDDDAREHHRALRDRLLAKATWMDDTIIEIIISEAQNEVADDKKCGLDIIPHPSRIKQRG